MLQQALKKIFGGFAFLSLVFSTQAQQAGNGYKIDLNIKPYQNQWVYLASYYGSIKTLADSAFLDANHKGAFKGTALLPGGIYIVASPQKTILFEMILDKEQNFSVSMDTLNPSASLKFTGSKDNDQFMAYTNYIGSKAESIEQLRKQQESTQDEKEKARIGGQIEALAKEINDYRLKQVEQYPEAMLSVLFKAMQEVPLPSHLKNPTSREDSIAQYRYLKEHYWDNYDFMDGRLVRTPMFDNRLKTYLNNWVVPDADSIIYEMNWMMALGRNDPEMSRYLIGYFIDNYMYPKIMGHDKVFLAAYERYVANDNPMTSWLNEKQRKAITERAYMVMANQLGAPAYDMTLVDTTGKTKTLYEVKSKYVVVSFWDPNCGKCREDLPKLDSLYKTAWKGKDIQVYAVMVNEDAQDEWKNMIRKIGKGWVHVHQTKEMRDAEEKAKQPNFRQLYDMRSTPTLFLLDKDKRIVAKNLGLEDLNNVLQQKIGQGT
jgi:thiol-disulfide isomerase/thioredoxin